MSKPAKQHSMTEIAIPEEWTIPAGYELSEESTDPVWFGPQFEGESFAQWRVTAGHEVVIISRGDYIAGPITIEEARELRRNLDGILSLIDPNAA